jgi:hypothetical protein
MINQTCNQDRFLIKSDYLRETTLHVPPQAITILFERWIWCHLNMIFIL